MQKYLGNNCDPVRYSLPGTLHETFAIGSGWLWMIVYGWVLVLHIFFAQTCLIGGFNQSEKY